jgi:hypothetical protein
VSKLNRVAAIASAAALLVTMSQSTAAADTPATGSGVGEHGSSHVPHRACKPQPSKPSYPLWPGSPACCTEPLTWRERHTDSRPGKKYWDCLMPTPLHL